MPHATFTKEQHKLAKARPDTARLISVTMRNPHSTDVMTVSLVTDIDTSNKIMSFMVGVAISEKSSHPATGVEVN